MTITTLLATLLFPIAVPFIATAVFWRKLDRRWLFLVVSFFSIVGMDYLAFDVLNNALDPHIVTAESGNVVASMTEFAHSRHISMVLTDAVVAVVGLPLLYWLFTALRRSPSPAVSA